MTPYQAYRFEVERLLEKGQLGGGWEVSFTDKEELESQARCTFCVGHRWVRFSFWPKEFGKLPLSCSRQLARHEVGHFITARLDELGSRRYITASEWSEELEAVARVMERLLA